MSELNTLLSDDQIERFIADGFLIVQSDVDKALHARVERRLREVDAAESWHGNNILPRIPELHEVLQCSVVRGALVSLLGEDYLLHPHRAVHRSVPLDEAVGVDVEADGTPMGKGSTAASVWHQDAQSPLARARHHLPRFIIGFYFPHDTPLVMGPTRLQAGSYFWSSPQPTPLGVVVPDHVAAGTVMLVHFDMVHAGLSNCSDSDRFMLKFVFNRVSNPSAPTWKSERSAWHGSQAQSVTAPTDAWQFVWRWMRGNATRPVTKTKPSDLHAQDLETSINSIYRCHDPKVLAQVLRGKAGLGLHERVLIGPYKGKRYIKDDVTGYPRRWNERAIVMEPEAYALGTQGVEAIPHLVELVELNDPWLNVNVAFALGEIAVMNDQVREVLSQLLASEHQQVVRQSIDAISFIQADAEPFLEQFMQFMTTDCEAWQRKEVERGWVAQEQIRLNVMFACVSLLTTATDPQRLEELFKSGLGDQGYCAEVAVEGLRRLGTPSALATALEFTAKRTWDAGLLGKQKPY